MIHTMGNLATDGLCIMQSQNFHIRSLRHVVLLCMMPSKQKRSCLSYSSLSIVLRKRKASSAALPSEADQKLAEKVHYTTGGGAVTLGENVACYETEYKYDEEAVYEVPT